MRTLTNTVALISGAAQGLGEGHARALAAQGVKVMVQDVPSQEEKLRGVVAAIKADGGEAEYTTNNICTVDGAAEAVAFTVEKFGKLNILINNAGITRDKTLFKMDVTAAVDPFITPVINVHVMGTIYLSLAFMKYRAGLDGETQASELGIIINTTSDAALHGSWSQAIYAGAKGFILAFSKTLAIEGAKLKIRVFTLCPVARTPMTEAVPSLLGTMDAMPQLFDRSHANTAIVALCKHGDEIKSGATFRPFGRSVRAIAYPIESDQVLAAGEAFDVDELGAAMVNLSAFYDGQPADMNARLMSLAGELVGA